ncbi:MAG: protein translocase subunit SecF [Acidobacteria bacterium]|nr:protein translocase subunit SecF [Acidobacteriota bacterium]
MLQLFKNANIRWMSLKWVFISVSAVLAVVGWVAVFTKGFSLSIDLKGGTIVQMKFAAKPDVEKVRAYFKKTFPEEFEEVALFGSARDNEVRAKLRMVKTEQKDQFQNLSRQLYQYLKEMTGENRYPAEFMDVNNTNQATKANLVKYFTSRGVLLTEQDGIPKTREGYEALAKAVIDYRTSHSGLIPGLDALKTAKVAVGDGEKPFPGAMVEEMKKGFYTGSFSILSVDSVGPTFGKVQREKAQWAVILSLVVMLLYIAFRFRLAYGVGATVAIAHDVVICLGLMALFNLEISLTAIAAMLTLVGYSVNDTIVVFDRIRENLKKADEKNRPFEEIINRAVNQTLSRTIITSGLTFVSVFCLLLFGGEALRGFSFVLTVGIIVGTYSSIAIASPVMCWWIKYLGTDKVKKNLKFA